MPAHCSHFKALHDFQIVQLKTSQPSVGLDSVMAPNTTLTLRLCAVALLSNNVVRLHDSRFRHLLFIYAHLGTLERVDHLAVGPPSY